MMIIRTEWSPIWSIMQRIWTSLICLISFSVSKQIFDRLLFNKHMGKPIYIQKSKAVLQILIANLNGKNN